jgi:hypothetical protein
MTEIAAASGGASTRRQEICTGLAILLVVWGGLLAGEFGLRMIQRSKFGVATTVERSEQFYVDPVTKLRLARPNQMLGNVRINNLGFRGPDVPAQKPAGTLRIAFLGSSTTYDAYADEQRNWPRLVVDQLRARVGQTCEIDFVNAAMPGFGTPHTIQLYAHKVRPLSADVVLFMPGDINQNLAGLAEQRGLETFSEPKDWLSRNSGLYALVRKNVRALRLQRSAFDRRGKLAFDVSEVVAPFDAQLDKLAVEVGKDGALLTLVTVSSQLRASQSPERKVQAAITALYYMPYVMIDDLILTREAYNRHLERFAAQRKAIVVGNENVIPADSTHFYDSLHFQPPGSAANAKRVASVLAASPEFQSAAGRHGCAVAD